MDKNGFLQRLEQAEPDSGWDVHLRALWYDARGDWQTAHDLIDQLTDKTSARLHAYLHRKEGDQWNADYWYGRAGEKRPALTLEEEWSELVDRQLASS
ncbi:MAG: hypothetical protein INR69_14075 [Mucilaginibacter polytrichastri]|nr:hypothetical protein [Mucilaginibacter polytrichastri]